MGLPYHVDVEVADGAQELPPDHPMSRAVADASSAEGAA